MSECANPCSSSSAQGSSLSSPCVQTNLGGVDSSSTVVHQTSPGIGAVMAANSLSDNALDESFLGEYIGDTPLLNASVNSQTLQNVSPMTESSSNMHASIESLQAVTCKCSPTTQSNTADVKLIEVNSSDAEDMASQVSFKTDMSFTDCKSTTVLSRKTSVIYSTSSEDESDKERLEQCKLFLKG